MLASQARFCLRLHPFYQIACYESTHASRGHLEFKKIINEVIGPFPFVCPACTKFISLYRSEIVGSLGIQHVHMCSWKPPNYFGEIKHPYQDLVLNLVRGPFLIPSTKFWIFTAFHFVLYQLLSRFLNNVTKTKLNFVRGRPAERKKLSANSSFIYPFDNWENKS